MTELPVWAVAPGVPSRHYARAALRAAALIDERGSPRRDLSKSYLHHASSGVFTDDDLRAGEQLLLDIGLAVLRGGRLHLTKELGDALAGSADTGVALIATSAYEQFLSATDGATTPETEESVAELVDDPELREQLLMALGQKHDGALRQRIGEIGEETVAELMREQLRALGRPGLASEVRRVSLISDALGYDISAPRLAGSKRLVEVKASTRDEDAVTLFLSRSESDVGARYPEDWFLVACLVTDIEERTAEVRGWCSHFQIAPFLPTNTARGRWNSVELSLPRKVFTPELPGAS